MEKIKNVRNDHFFEFEGMTYVKTGYNATTKKYEARRLYDDKRCEFNCDELVQPATPKEAKEIKAALFQRL